MKWAVIISGIVYLCNMFSTAGKENAKDKITFYIANDYQNKIVVHSTSDYYILMESENNKLLDTYQIVPSNEIGTITKKEIGRLLIENTSKRNNNNK